MDAQPVYQTLPGILRRARMGKNNPMLLEILLIAVAAVAIWAIYHFVPTRERQATVPSENTQAIRGLQSSQLRLIDQVNALQEAVSSGQGETSAIVGRSDRPEREARSFTTFGR